MSPLLIMAIIFITLALFLYTVGVWSERISKTLTAVHLFFFWGGLVCDGIGTHLMTRLTSSANADTFSLHGITGSVAIILMLIHAVWATVVVIKKDEKSTHTFHNFSLFVWIVWLFPYILGMLMGKTNPEMATTKPESALRITDVTVITSVRKTGQYPEEIVIALSEPFKSSINASDFQMKGHADKWQDTSLHSFECDIETVNVEGDVISIIPKNFPEKFFYVKDFSITCNSYPELSFTNDDVTNVVTPVADNFKTMTADSVASFNYHLFTPENPENMPIVIVFHGYGDTSNLLTYRTAVEWAEPENQKVRPCYVLAPVIPDEKYFEASSRSTILDTVKELVDEMISEGKVDPSRIYVMGNSFGGLSTIEFCEKYPDFVAGAIALCPALNYAPAASMNLGKMANVPIWFAQAEHDGTIPVTESRNAYKKLESIGAREVYFTEYTDDEMNAAGANASNDSTYSYHHVELAVMEDESYQTWLFEKALSTTARPQGN